MTSCFLSPFLLVDIHLHGVFLFNVSLLDCLLSQLALPLTIWSQLLSCVVLVRSCSTTYYLESVAVLCGAGQVLLHYLLSGVCCCLVWCRSGLAPLLTIWSLLLSCVVLVRSCSTTYYLESVAVLCGAGLVLLHYLLSGVCCCLVWCWSGLAPLLTYYLESVAVLCGAGQVLLCHSLSGVYCCLVWCWSGLALSFPQLDCALSLSCFSISSNSLSYLFCCCFLLPPMHLNVGSCT